MEIGSSFISLGIFVILIILCWKGKFWGAVLFTFIPFCFVYSACVGLILAYSIPGESVQIGPNLPYIPFLVSALLLLATVLSVVLGQKTNNSREEKSSFLRWIILILGIIVLAIGLILFCCSIYSPQIVGYKVATPQIGVILYLAFSSIACIILYFASKMNSPKTPNLFRWIVFFIIFFSSSLPMVGSLILIYSVPYNPKASFTFLSSICTLGYIPYALLLIGMTREYVKKDKIVESVIV